MATLPVAEPVHKGLAWVVGTVAGWLLRAYHASWRKDDSEIVRLDQILATGERILVVFWHGKYFPLFSLLSGRSACIFASHTFRGRVIAEVARRFGYDCILLPDGGGKKSLSLLREALRDHRGAGIAVDGPVGPYHVVKRGAFDLAGELGYVLLPVSTACNWKRVMHRRWDLREIPWPFSRLILTVGEPIRVPSSIGRRDVTVMRERLREVLESLDRRAEERALSPQ